MYLMYDTIIIPYRAYLVLILTLLFIYPTFHLHLLMIAPFDEYRVKALHVLELSLPRLRDS